MKLIATERVMRPMALRPELGNPSRFPAWTQDADPTGTADAPVARQRSRRLRFWRGALSLKRASPFGARATRHPTTDAK
jgi:hypothetical protein